MAQEWMTELAKGGWLDILKVVLPSSAISALITIVWNARRDARLRRTDRKEAALLVALALESNARMCMAMLHRADWASRSATQTQSYDSINGVKLPEFSFPEKLEWKWLSTKVTSELREFPATLHSTRESLGSVREYGDPLTFCEEVAFKKREGREASAGAGADDPPKVWRGGLETGRDRLGPLQGAIRTHFADRGKSPQTT